MEAMLGGHTNPRVINNFVSCFMESILADGHISENYLLFLWSLSLREGSLGNWEPVSGWEI